MGKGHAPRQGRDDKAFAAGYDGIDWGRAKIVGPVIASDGGKYSATQNADGSVTITPVAPPTGVPVSYRFDDARQHVRDVAANVSCTRADGTPMQPSDEERPDDVVTETWGPFTWPKRSQRQPVRITGNFRCKVNGMDVLNDAGFEILTQPGFDYVLEAIEPPAKTCKECAHASDILECKNPEIRSFMQNNMQVDFLVTSDFSCNRWEAKV